MGNSLLEADWLDYCREMMQKAKDKGVKLLLPVDGVAAAEFSADAKPVAVDGAGIPDGMMGMDIGPKTIALYAAAVKEAGTVIWNGPMGVFEFPAFAEAPGPWPRPWPRPTPSPLWAAVTPRPPWPSWATPTK